MLADAMGQRDALPDRPYRLIGHRQYDVTRSVAQHGAGAALGVAAPYRLGHGERGMLPGQLEKIGVLTDASVRRRVRLSL